MRGARAASASVAQDVTQSASDCAELLPMMDAVEANLGRKPEQASANAGYCSEDNLAGLEARNTDGYVAAGRATVFGQIKQARGFRQFLLRGSKTCAPIGLLSAPPTIFSSSLTVGFCP
jgi:hypothetical protein